MGNSVKLLNIDFTIEDDTRLYLRGHSAGMTAKLYKMVTETQPKSKNYPKNMRAP